MHLTRAMPEVDRQAAALAGVVARRKRAAIKSALFSGHRSPLDVLIVASVDPSSSEATIRVTDFLSSLRSIGEKKRSAVLHDLGISPRKRLGGLGKHQLRLLTAWVHDYQQLRNMRWPAQAIVLLGPSGVGKGTIVSQIIQDHPDVYVSISATTRQPRSTEVDGVSYFFTSEPEFTAMIGRGELLEWAQVHGQHFYGTPREPIDKALAVGKPVLFEIDLQGARQIKETMPEVRTVFLLPPSWDELVKRLRTRATESEEEIQLRLNTAWGELAQQDEFDVRLVNDDVRKTAQQVVDLMGLNKE